MRPSWQLIEKEKLEHELEIARAIQKSILPEHIPNIQGWQIAAHWQPARSVSGDFFDIFPYPDGRLGFLIADVSGKGVPAALVMATTCSTLRAVASSELSPGALLEQGNHLLCPYMPRNMFVTCLNKVSYTADQMLEERLVQVTPAELFKTRYNQNINLIMLDVRPEADVTE